jgi:hypothetical protein
MKNRHLRYLLIFTILALVLVACGSQNNPKDVYTQYWEACSQGDFLEAEKFLEESARDKARTLGVCGFAHDAINTVELANGRPARNFPDGPEVSITDTTASLTWYDDQGHVANVVLVEIEGDWKLVEAVWSK